MNTKQSIGERVEDWFLYNGKCLNADERAEVIAFALSFEECWHDEATLKQMHDPDLVGAAYWAMAEYASGQL